MFFGFEPTALPEEREAAVGQWESWWAANRGKTKEQWLTDSLSLEGYKAKQLALQTLAEMSAESAIPAITETLGDPDPGIRAEAAKSLGILKAQAAVGKLSGILEADEDVKVRRAAARALGQIGTGEAFSKLELTAGHKDELTRIEAASALVLHAPEQALPVLHSLLSDGSSDARLFAITRLGALKKPESVPHLVKLLETEIYSGKIREALQAIVGEDLGPEPEPWIEWYERYRQENREKPI
jgi:HEAT repeat protein